VPKDSCVLFSRELPTKLPIAVGVQVREELVEKLRCAAQYARVLAGHSPAEASGPENLTPSGEFEHELDHRV
jgi:hypothetical protein